jgi:hypothetical protein
MKPSTLRMEARLKAVDGAVSALMRALNAMRDEMFNQINTNEGET